MVQWFPGHMKKAHDEIRQAIDRIDVVIEILDARLPVSSMNPVLKEVRKDKPCLKLLNKEDLADPVVTKKWLKKLNADRSVKAVSLQATNRKMVKKIIELPRQMLAYEIKRPVKVMVVGIPNVGKSTFINTLAGRKVAKVGDEPAVTRHQQRFHVAGGRKGLDISDTPGVLWPNLEDREGAYRLAATGAVKSTAMDFQDVAMFTAGFLLNAYPQLLKNRYKLADIPETANQLLSAIAIKRGCLKSGAEVDYHKASELLLRDLRQGKLGRVSLENP